MAGIEVMPRRREAGDSAEWLQWNINRNLKAGAKFTAMGHTVTVERIVEARPEYNVALVSVGEAIGTAPPLRFTGDFTFETRSADNAFRGGMR